MHTKSFWVTRAGEILVGQRPFLSEICISSEEERDINQFIVYDGNINNFN
jgi:hypothetical protein